MKKMTESVKTVVLKMLSKNKVLAFGIAVTAGAAIIAALLPPLVLAEILDTITAGSGILISQVLLYFGFTALTGAMEAAREGLLTVFGQKMTHTLRSSLMAKFVRLTSDGLTKQEPGALVSRFVGDTDTVEKLFTSGVISMFADACKIISILLVIWFQNRGLAFILLLMLPFLFAFTRCIQKNMLAAQLENRRAVSRASAFVPETLHNIRTIHCFGKEAYMEKKYDEYIRQSYRAVEKTNFYDAVYSPVILVLNALVVAVVMLLSASGNAALLGLFGMSAGTAVAVMNYISQIFSPIESLGMEIQTIQSAVAGVKRINEFFALPEKEEKPREADEDLNKVSDKASGKVSDKAPNKASNGVSVNFRNPHKNAPLVEFRNVTFGYDGQQPPVVSAFNLTVRAGEQITFSGRTGAGKSTLLKLLLGLYTPWEGSVLIEGEEARYIPDEKKRGIFGYVEQSFQMIPGTVKEQITLYDPAISMKAVQKAAELAGLDAVIRQLENGYDTVCTPELFSQGQWQLLSIARAVAAGPKLLLLDEITANLDAETEKAVLQALSRAAENRTVLSVSHRTAAKSGRIVSI